MATSRDDHKRQVRQSLVDSAMRLFARQGFEATTIDAIADAAGCSRRTYFRYFATKEAVVFPRRQERLEAFGVALGLRLQDAPPLQAVREACLAMAEDYSEHADQELTRRRVVQTSPTLMASELQIYETWETTIADAVTRRRSSAKRRRQARLFAAATLGVLRTTLREWYAGECSKNLMTLGRQAFELLEAGFDADAMP